MDRNRLADISADHPRSVKLDHHDSVRSHIRQQIMAEVAQLEHRIELLRLTRAPHASLMISAYERVVERKRGFLKNWDLQDLAAH